MDFQIIIQLFLAVFLGGLIGLEREWKKKEAGLQTYSLISLGACLFTIITFEILKLSIGGQNISFDPGRIIQAVAIGIGFIGAGVVMRREFRIEGLTTAAGLWVTAAIGITVGIQFYSLAISATILTLAILLVFGWIEHKFLNKNN